MANKAKYDPSSPSWGRGREMGGLDANALFLVKRMLHRPPSQTLPHKGEGLLQRDSFHFRPPLPPLTQVQFPRRLAPPCREIAQMSGH
ncbi:MAG: hypothetical protein RL186_497 [Pseudomonadota bacterium]|jgi:hypothetical protein